jgi:hypothetical protein
VKAAAKSRSLRDDGKERDDGNKRDDGKERDDGLRTVSFPHSAGPPGSGTQNEADAL